MFHRLKAEEGWSALADGGVGPMLGQAVAPVEAARRPSTRMRGPTDQELSPAAAQRILRSIAKRDWTKLDQTARAAQGDPVFVDTPAQEDVFDDIQGDDELTSCQAFSGRKHAGAWYLNEVPEELIDDYEKDLWTPDTRIDLREAAPVGCGVDVAGPDGGATIEDVHSVWL
jgi:hypothetical protein